MSDLVYPPVIKIAKLFWRYLGLKFTVTGEENIPEQGHAGGAIIAINHIGYLDFALTGTAYLPAKRYIRFMAKKEIFENKFAGPLMRGMHHINVDRANGSASFVTALRALRAGELVGIFPEATISRSFEIKEMKTGVVRLAMGANVPVIPTIIWGSQRLWTKGAKGSRRSLKRARVPIFISIGEPMFFSKDQDATACEASLRAKMKEMLDEIQAVYPDNYAGQWWAPLRLGGTAPAPLNS